MDVQVLTISDANVIIDIEKGELTSALFSLSNMSFFVPDVLFEKELYEKHSHLKERGLNLCKLSGDSVAEVFKLAQQHGKVSSLDLFALQLAIEKSAILLTGDKALRKVAEKYKVECHGTLWLVELMVKQRIIKQTVAANAYKMMEDAGSRLPWKDAVSRLKNI
jgi:predicted nucleic acid-binding protein